MESTTKIVSVDINLTDANNEVGMVACDGFSLSGLIGGSRDVYRTTCWPFPEEGASLGWWSRLSCTRNIDADGTSDSGLPSNSRSIISTNGLNGSSSIIHSQSALNSLTAIAGNAVVVNEDANCQRSQNDDQTAGNAAVENEDVNCERSVQDGNAVVENEDVNRERSQHQRDNAAEDNEDVNCERSHKDDQPANNALVVNEDVNCERSQRVTRSSKKVHPTPFRTYALRNKSTKNAVAEPTGNKRAEKQPNVEQLAVTETDARVEDIQPLFIGGAPSRRPRTVRTRRLAEISGTPKARSEDNISRKSSLRGHKRPSPPASRKVSTAGAASRNASKSVDSNHGRSVPTESGLDINSVKGKKKNVRFQVDDDLDTDPEVDEEDDWDPHPPRAKRTKKAKISGKKTATPAKDPSNKASSSVQPSLNETETVPSPPREQRTEEREGNSLDDQLASEGYIRKPNAPPVNEREDNQRTTPPSTVVAAQSTVPQKDASIPNAGRGLGTGPGGISLGSSSNNVVNNNLRSTPPSTIVAAQHTVPGKDATVPNTSRGLVTGRGAIDLGRGSNRNTNLRSSPPSTVVAAQHTVQRKDATILNTSRGLGTGRDAIFLGRGSNRNNNLRSTPPSTVVAAQHTVPHKDATILNTSRGLGTGRDAIYLGRGSNSNTSLRSTPLSTVVAAQRTVPHKGATIPNTGRGLGTGRDAIFLGRGSNSNTNLRSTPPSTVVAAQHTVPHKDATIPNASRGLGTGRVAISLGRGNNSNTNQRSTPPSTVAAAQHTVPREDASIPNTGRGLGTGHGTLYFGSSNNLRRTLPSTVVASQSSVPQKDASVSDRKGKGIMGMSNNLPQEVPQKPKTPLPFDLNETYEDVTSLEENTNAAREEARVPVRSEQTPRQNSYRAYPSLMPPPVQESRRSSNLFPGHNSQWMGNVPMASPYHHHPSSSTYPEIRVPPRHYRAPSPPVWASTMTPPQYHHHHHHPSPPAPFNMDYSGMFAQEPSSDTWNLSYIGANLLNQAMMSRMDPRFRSNPPVDHHGNFAFAPRHVHPGNQFNRLVELQRSHERPAFPRTVSNQRRFQQRRYAASSSNASTSYAVNSSESSECIVSRYPGEITDIETYMVGEEDLRVPERIAEFEEAEDQVGGFTESG